MVVTAADSNEVCGGVTVECRSNRSLVLHKAASEQNAGGVEACGSASWTLEIFH